MQPAPNQSRVESFETGAHPSAEAMSVREIKAAITKLSPGDLAELAAWFADHHNREWDEQIERDLDSGRIDAFLAEAEAEYEAGQAKPL